MVGGGAAATNSPPEDRSGLAASSQADRSQHQHHESTGHPGVPGFDHLRGAIVSALNRSPPNGQRPWRMQPLRHAIVVRDSFINIADFEKFIPPKHLPTGGWYEKLNFNGVPLSLVNPL